MKLQRTTLILLLLALGLGGFVYFYEIQGAPQREEAKARGQQIFSFEEEQVQSLKLKTKGQTLEFERENASGQAKWQMKSPELVVANDASVVYLLNLLAKGKSDRTISVPATQVQDYGLTQPQATIEVKLKDQKTHQLVLGKPDFNRSFLYAQADPPAKSAAKVDVLLVSTDFENAINRPLSEWKSEETSKPKTPSQNAKQPTQAPAKSNK